MSEIYKILLLVLSVLISMPISSQQIVKDGVPRDTSYTVYSSFIKEKKKFPFIQAVDTSIPDGIKGQEGIVYKQISNTRSLQLSIYRPDNLETYPIVLIIHGGGWNSGSPDMLKPLAINLARKGLATATVEYRLTPEAIYPAAVNDLNDALQWLHDNADNYHLNKDQIAVAGCSAGGQLAALIGTKNESNLIKAIVNIDGISTFIDETTINRAQKAKDNGGKTPVDALWLGGTYKEKSENWNNASALNWINSKSAPTCFINSSIARFHNGRNEHIKQLDSLGIYSEVHTFEDTPHTFWHFHPWHLSTVNYAANFLWKIFDNPTPCSSDNFDVVIAQDGSGHYTTVQEAIDAVPDFRKQTTRIFIKNGIYREKIIIPDTKHDIILVGEDKLKTILSYNNFASKKSILGDEIGTSGSASTYVLPNNFTAQNITFENAAGPIGQAVAIIVRSDNAQFINCRFIGFQDTLYTHKANSKQYYKNCYIEGTVDFIFGSSIAFFENCEIYCKKNGYISAASTPEDQEYGYVFYKCSILGEMPGSFYLGRPWRPFAHVAFIECNLNDIIKPEGWDNWRNPNNEKTATFVEYKNKIKNNKDKRVTWSTELSTEEAKRYSKDNVLGHNFMNIKSSK